MKTIQNTRISGNVMEGLVVPTMIICTGCGNNDALSLIFKPDENLHRAGVRCGKCKDKHNEPRWIKWISEENNDLIADQIAAAIKQRIQALQAARPMNHSELLSVSNNARIAETLIEMVLKCGAKRLGFGAASAAVWRWLVSPVPKVFSDTIPASEEGTFGAAFRAMDTVGKRQVFNEIYCKCLANRKELGPDRIREGVKAWVNRPLAEKKEHVHA